MTAPHGAREPRELVAVEQRGRAQAAEIHAEVLTWRCLWCHGPLVEHKQWFWCSPSCRERSLEQERGRDDTPTDTGALICQDSES